MRRGEDLRQHDAFVAYSSTVSDEATSIIDSRAVSGTATPGAIILPLTATARECGAALATNIVGLGALVGIAGLVSERSLRKALVARVALELLALNTQALTAGLRIAAHVTV